MKLRADLHIHSEYSHDSYSKIDKILKVAKEKKLDVIAITDHEEFDGANLAEKLAENVLVIKGQEINTEFGDIIGLFLKKKVDSKKFAKVIKEIKKQKGVVVLPHPAKFHILIKEVVDNVDLIEVFNSRLGKEENKMGRILADKLKKPFIAGSDAHFIFEIGNGVTIIESKSRELKDIKDSLIKNKINLDCKSSSKIRKLFIKLTKMLGRRK